MTSYKANLIQMQTADIDGENSPTRIPSLTGIRGLAAVWVTMFHVIQMSWHFDLPLKLPGHIVAMSGWAGVDLFFVLSGFMLMHAHGHQFMELSKPVCSDFALSRFFRVFPLSAAVLLGGVDKFEPVSGGGDMDHAEKAFG